MAWLFFFANVPEVDVQVLEAIRLREQVTAPEALDREARNRRNDPVLLHVDPQDPLFRGHVHPPNVQVLVVDRGREVLGVDPVHAQNALLESSAHLVLVVVPDEFQPVLLFELFADLVVKALQVVHQQIHLRVLTEQNDSISERVNFDYRNIVFFPHELDFEFARCALDDVHFSG